jgi:hypothetical protein
MEAALRVFVDELGLKEQLLGAGQMLTAFAEDGCGKVRYISDWRPVEQGDAK